MSTQSNIYAGQRTKSLSTSSDYKIFVGILILSGYRKQPRQEMIWTSDGDVGCDLMNNVMTKNRFLALKASLEMNDKFPKIARVRCTEFIRFSKNRINIFSNSLSLKKCIH